MPRYRARLAAIVGALLVAGCTAGPGPDAVGPSRTATPPPAPPQPRTALPPEATTVITGADAAALALATSRALFRHAPAVVLAGAGDADSLAQAGAAAVKLGVPLLLTPASGDTNKTAVLRAELDRLAARTLVPIGTAASTWANPDAPAETPSPSAPQTAAPAEAAVAPDLADDAALPDVMPAPPLGELLVLALDRASSQAATATARAAGARVLLMAGADPRTDSEAIAALAGQSTQRVLALGDEFGPAERLRRRIDTAATGVLLPGGGQVLFPGRRMVALYGHPGDSRLGSLGEQGAAAAVTRAKKVAASYAALVDEPVVPTFEIIATVASAGAGSDGNYSNESSIAHLRPWVDAAKAAGVYVVLDLQPGRTDFLSQAKLYTELLKQPHVGLALDPEWRLGPGQRHMVQIGSVSAAEVNATASWLAELTREHKLPQKVLMLHQFRLDMITNRASIDTDHDELSVVIHADGFGSAGQKYNTWRAMHINPPANVWWGWKNFYDEDRPTFTPSQTVAVSPSPVFVSYQ